MQIDDTGSGSCTPHDDELRLGPVGRFADFLTELLAFRFVGLSLRLVEFLDLLLGELLKTLLGCDLFALLGTLLRHEQRTAEDEDAEFQHQETEPVTVGQEGEQRRAANHEVVRRCTPPGGPELGATLQPPPVSSASSDQHGCGEDNSQRHVNSPFREIGWRYATMNTYTVQMHCKNLILKSPHAHNSRAM